MPLWELPHRTYDVPRNIALLDTNVLIAFVDPANSHHRDTVAVIDMAEYRWAVIQPTVFEAWNLIVGRRKQRQLAYGLMQWLLTPGEVLWIGDSIEHTETAHRYSTEYRLDIVDANLLDVASRISNDCEIRPAVHVATYDTRDFLRVFGQPGLLFHVYDMRDLSSTSGSP